MCTPRSSDMLPCSGRSDFSGLPEKSLRPPQATIYPCEMFWSGGGRIFQPSEGLAGPRRRFEILHLLHLPPLRVRSCF